MNNFVKRIYVLRKYYNQYIKSVSSNKYLGAYAELHSAYIHSKETRGR